MTLVTSRVPVLLAAAAAVIGLGSATRSEAAGATVVVNEIHATGIDWVELYNAGPDSLDLLNWRLAECDEKGQSRLRDAVRFSRSTVLAPGAYLLVVTDRVEKRLKEPNAMRRLCPSGGPGRCVRMSWGVGQKRGDILRLITPDGRLSSEVRYPAGVVPKGHSWARQPDGADVFGVADPTPGATNPKGYGP